MDNEAEEGLRNAIKVVDALTTEDPEAMEKVLYELTNPVVLILALARLVATQTKAMADLLGVNPRELWIQVAKGEFMAMEHERMILDAADAMEKVVDGGT